MNAKDKLEALVAQLGTDPNTEKYWNVFLQFYKQYGLAYLRKLLSMEKQQQYLLQNLQAINSGQDLKTLLNLILDNAITLTSAERGFLILGEIEIARNFDREDIVGDYKISRRIAQSVMESGQAILSDNAQEDQRFSPYTSVQQHRLVSIICAPLIVKNKVIGAIYIDNRLVIANFQNYELGLLCTFAAQAVLAIENAHLHIQTTQRAHNAEKINIDLRTQVKLQTAELELAKSSILISDAQNYWNICAKSQKMQEIFAIIERVKDSDLPVLIKGESGTGKELIAQALHFKSNRKEQNFVSENCAAIPENIFESELFGHEKGSFTGADKTKKGLFEDAHQGTLFLDEVAELPLPLQKKLLRTLAEKKIRRVGGKEPIDINTRIITATNRNLKDMISEGAFREDLFYRLNVIEITLPPLRERKEDIPILVEYFISEKMKLAKEKSKKVDPRLLSVLMKYHWPGNIRQLRNEIYRLIILCDNILSPEYLSKEILENNVNIKKDEPVTNLNKLLRDVEKNEIEKALKICENNKSKASQILGISRFSLQRKLEKYQME